MKLRLFCNEQAVGWLDTSSASGAAAANAWRLEFDVTPPVPLAPHLTAAAAPAVALLAGSAVAPLAAPVVAPAMVSIATSAVRDFFVNYLPEPPHAGRVARSFTPVPRNEAELLAVLGQELAGAYALAPAKLGEARYAPLAWDEFEARVAESRQSAAVIAFAAHAPRLSLAGAQDKFALWFDPTAATAGARLKIPLGRAASTHIFKPASTDSRFAMLPANEFACARLARAAGLPVVESSIHTFGGVRVLVVARFDRQVDRPVDCRVGRRVKPGAGDAGDASDSSDSSDKGAHAHVTRLHQIDLCQMLDQPRENKYGSEGGIDTAGLFAACGHTGVPALARRVLLRAWLFNFLIGNADAHAKNHSFLWQPDARQWQVSPLYDLLSVAPYLPAQPQSMGLLGEYRPGWFEAAHWRELARLAGVTPAYLAAEVARMTAAVRGAAQALAGELRAVLTPDELDFLAGRVNPVVQERAAWLQASL